MPIVRYSKNLDAALSNPHCGTQIRMAAGLADVIEREEALVAAACNHPNLLVLPFRLELIRVAA